MSFPSPINLSLNSHARDVNCLTRLFCCLSTRDHGNVQINTNDQIHNGEKDEDNTSSLNSKSNKKMEMPTNHTSKYFENEDVIESNKKSLPVIEEDEDEEMVIQSNINKNLVFSRQEFRLENEKEKKISQKFHQVKDKLIQGEDLSSSEKTLLVKGQKMRQTTVTAFFNGLAQYGHMQREIYLSMAKIDPVSCYKECKSITVRDQREIKKARSFFLEDEKILKVIIKRIQLATKFLELHPEITLYKNYLPIEGLDSLHQSSSPSHDLSDKIENLRISKQTTCVLQKREKNKNDEYMEPIFTQPQSLPSLRTENEIVLDNSILSKEPNLFESSHYAKPIKEVQKKKGSIQHEMFVSKEKKGNSPSQSSKIDMLFLRVANQVGCFDPVDIKRLGRKMRKLDVATLKEAYELDVKYEYPRISESEVHGIIAIVQACANVYRKKRVEKKSKQEGMSMQSIFEEVLKNCLYEAQVVEERKGSINSEFLFLSN